MVTSIKDRVQALEILKDYNGSNPYILMLKRDIFVKGEKITDFAIEYIIKNKNFQPVQINKTIKIANWYQEKKKEDWGIDFLPQKLAIKWLMGETSTTYHCYVKYRQSVDPVQVFLPKKAVLTNFLVTDFNNTFVDFDRYDRLSMSKDINRRLREHQKDAVKFLLNRKKCVLADEPGYGKTTELAVAAIEGNFDSVLIICPASIKSTWKKELMWYVPERDITIVEGIQGKTKSELETYLGYGVGKSGKKVSELQMEAKERGKWQDNRFVIVNFDILDEVYKIPETRSKVNIEKAFNNSPMLQYLVNRKSLIIIDEAHRLSDMTSIRYKVIKDMIKRANPDSIYAATGTPITNNPQNFYCVLQFLGDPITDDYNYYMERYCNARKFPKNAEEKEKRRIISENFIQSKGKSNWYQLNEEEKNELNDIIDRNVKMITVPDGSSNLEELKERVSHIYLRRVKEDLKGMVKKHVHELYYSLNSQQKSEYNKLWDEYEASQYESNPDKELNKELIEGSIYRRYLSNQMVPYTIQLTDKFIQNGEKVVIGCCYDEELYQLKEYYGDKCVIYNGKMSSKEKDNAQETFMNNPDVKVFIGNLQSAGLGLTLTVAKKLIFNDFSYVKGDNDQFQDRIHRINQTEDVDVYFQIFRDTQYQKMWEIVLRKGYVIDQIIKKESEK
jgi:SWI/SNF-related matrix-associated actin-dependent regulator 1 of chromatin subfamily A